MLNRFGGHQARLYAFDECIVTQARTDSDIDTAYDFLPQPDTPRAEGTRLVAVSNCGPDKG